MRTLLPALLGAVFCAGAMAQSVEAPVLKPGDSWTYRVTEERAPSGWVQNRNEFTVERFTGSAIYYTAKQAGSSQTPRELLSGPDWSRMRDVNGKEDHRQPADGVSAGRWQVVGARLQRAQPEQDA